MRAGQPGLFSIHWRHEFTEEAGGLPDRQRHVEVFPASCLWVSSIAHAQEGRLTTGLRFIAHNR
eukprot:2177052-Amphidinium_carterae.1